MRILSFMATALTGAAIILSPQCHATGGAEQKPPEEGRCSFTNLSYAGVCVETPARGDTCESVLKYLNNPRAAGKRYCANTSIRGGWKLAKPGKKAEKQRNSSKPR